MRTTTGRSDDAITTLSSRLDEDINLPFFRSRSASQLLVAPAIFAPIIEVSDLEKEEALHPAISDAIEKGIKSGSLGVVLKQLPDVFILTLQHCQVAADRATDDADSLTATLIPTVDLCGLRTLDHVALPERHRSLGAVLSGRDDTEPVAVRRTRHLVLSGKLHGYPQRSSNT
jgi:hypothetical protein